MSTADNVVVSDRDTTLRYVLYLINIQNITIKETHE